MSVTVADLLERNKSVSSTHTPIPTLSDFSSMGAPMPTTLIVTCMDPRCVPEKYFNLQLGEVLVVRNGGGNVRQALRDITIVDQMFDLQELAIIHHTDCGTLTWTEDQMREKVKASFDKMHWPEIESTVYGANADIVESVKDDVEWVKAHPLITDKVKKGCQGFVFDIRSGKVERVEV